MRQAGDAWRTLGDRGGFRERQFEAVPLFGDGIGGARGVQPFADFGADQGGPASRPVMWSRTTR